MEAIEWQWDNTDSGRYAEDKDSRFVFALRDDPHIAEIKCVDFAGNVKWVKIIPATTVNSAALTVYNNKLYVALYWHGSTGCRVLALDSFSGEQLWETTVQGIGSMGHSRYANRVQIRIRDEWLVVFGDESSGRYIEVLDPSSGRLVCNKRVQS